MSESRLPKRLQYFIITACLLGIVNALAAPLIAKVIVASAANGQAAHADPATTLALVATTLDLLFRACFGALVFFDARARKQSPLLWTALALVFKIEGVILYFVYTLVEQQSRCEEKPQ